MRTGSLPSLCENERHETSAKGEGEEGVSTRIWPRGAHQYPLIRRARKLAPLLPLLRPVISDLRAAGIGRGPLSIHPGAGPGGALYGYVLGGFCLTAAADGAASNEANVISTLNTEDIRISRQRSIKVSSLLVSAQCLYDTARKFHQYL